MMSNHIKADDKRTMMSEDEDDPIRVNAGEPAALHSNGDVAYCRTLQEAVIAWRRLPEQYRQAAMIRVSGAIYTAEEIPRLDYGRASKAT